MTRPPASNGRPLEPDAAPVVVTADIGGTSVKIGASMGGRILDPIEKHDTAALDSGDPCDRLAEWIARFNARLGLAPDLLVATVPGSIGHDFDLVLRTANVPNLQNRRLRTGLAARLGLPTVIERDVHVLLRGEVVDHAIVERHVLGVFVGTGIGAAYLADGEIFRGSGWALQLGLTPVRGEGKERSWARPDAFEVYASGRAMSEYAEEAGFPIGAFFRHVARDAGAATWFESAFRDLVLHIATTVILFSPDVLVLGGGVLEMDGFPLERLAQAIRERIPLHDPNRPLRIVHSRLGWKAALLGGENLLRSPTDAALRGSASPANAVASV